MVDESSELPRDLQLRVLSLAFSDMDLRIQWGAIGRLRVPPTVAERISSVLKVPHTHVIRDDVGRVILAMTTTGSTTKFLLRTWAVRRHADGDGGGSSSTTVYDCIWLRPYSAFMYSPLENKYMIY